MKASTLHRPSPKPSAPRPRRRYRRDRGFTLIEAALTTIIVGTGVLAIVAAQQAYHQKNDWAARTGEAMLLANEVRELTLSLPLHDPITGTSHFGPEDDEGRVAITQGGKAVGHRLTYDDLDDFAGHVGGDGLGTGLTLEHPIDALRREIPDLDRWSEKISVGNVFPDWINAEDYQPMGTTDTMRVTVTILYQGAGEDEPRAINTLSWVVTQ